EIAYPVRTIVGRKRIEFRVAEVSAVDLNGRVVHADGEDIPYDYLVLAAGSTTNFYGVEGASQVGLGLKDLPEALGLRNHLLRTLEQALGERDAARRQELLTVVIVGGGPTGVELAGAVTQLLRRTIEQDFPALDAGDVRVL